ncbi:MAG: FCD domain-containing protein [Acidimicrobiia bacterium]
MGPWYVAILEALEARDPERAAQAMREHANEAEALVQAMKDTPDDREEAKLSK